MSSVASKMTTRSVQDMIRAMIAGERDPVVLAGLARTRMRAKHAALAEALDGQFAGHHAEIAQILLDQIDFLGKRIARLTLLIEEAIDAIPAAWGADPDGVDRRRRRDHAGRPGAARDHAAGRNPWRQRRAGLLDHRRVG